MSSAYEKINWKDYPDTSTPITAEKLNHMDNQIKQNADDIDTAKSDIEDLNNTAEDLQHQVDQKTIDIINATWINNMITPEETLKQIGKYNGENPHYSFNIDQAINDEGVSHIEFSIPLVSAYGSDITITGITGVILDSDKNAYPVNYASNTKSFYVHMDATNKEIVCSWNNIGSPCRILLTVTYAYMSNAT